MIKLIVVVALLSFVLLANPVLAQPNFYAKELTSPGTNKILNLPSASENSPIIIPLGTAIDPQSGKTVDGIAILHPKKVFHHRPDHAKGPKDNGNTTESSCFAFLSKGAYWKTVEDWKVNTTNSEGLSSSFVFNTLDAAISKWEDAAGVNILGNGSTTNSLLEADMVNPDGINEVYFGDVSSSGSIAVTVVWGIFNGKPSNRVLVEWDQIYDEADFDWSSTGEVGKMDFENISTHEIGHSTGMGHPTDTCTDETMFRFASEGETYKRNLFDGDIAGIADLYN